MTTESEKPEGAQFREALKANSEFLFSFVKWGALLIGGMCLLTYTMEIGRFPEGIGLGEGLAFYMISAGFLFVYLFYWIAATAVGSVVMRVVIETVRYAVRKMGKTETKKSNQLLPIRTNFSAMTSVEVVPLALLGAAFIALMMLFGEMHWSFHLITPIVQGTLIGLWLLFLRRKEFDASGIVFPGTESKSAGEMRKGRAAVRNVFPLLLLVAPLFTMAERSFFVNAAFRATQIRKENVSIHVQAPWEAPFTRAGLTSTEIYLGSDYVMFPCSKVLLHGIGSTVIVEIPRVRMEMTKGSSACKEIAGNQKHSKMVVSILSDKNMGGVSAI